jgi:hypothetical protein
VSSISRQLLGSLLGEWGLRQQLAALRNLYCLTSPTVVAWADVLLDRAASAARSGGLAAVDLSEMEALLGDMIVAAAGWEDLPDPSLLSLSLQSTSSGGGSTSSSRPGTAGTGAATAGGAQVAVGSSSSAGEAAAALVADVAGLAVHHGSSWLLSLVLDSAQLQQLNKVRASVDCMSVAVVHRLCVAMCDDLLAAGQRAEALALHMVPSLHSGCAKHLLLLLSPGEHPLCVPPSSPLPNHMQKHTPLPSPGLSPQHLALGFLLQLRY